MKKLSEVLKKEGKAYLGVIVVRIFASGLIVIAKIALNHGMSPQVYSLYRYLVASIVVAPFCFLSYRKRPRPHMTWCTFAKIILLGSIESVVVTNTYFTGLKYVTPTFSIAMSNAVPALSFFFAWVFRMEKVDVRRVSSGAKILGTAVAVGGAMIMTFVEGPKLRFPWTNRHYNSHNYPSTSSTNVNNKDSFKGVLLVTLSCLCASVSCILQAIVLKSYPMGLIVTFLVCIVGVVEGTVIAVVMEWNNPSVWSIHFDFQLLAILYAGIIISGFSYYIQGVVMEEKGPVFFTAFFPLSTIMVAIISSFAISEILSSGKSLKVIKEIEGA
ncbi:WAT1-related protein At2g39510 isoform X2 [Cucumis sativus]|uniref:WAT1-related protein At2g39510 isoform X2 n=1 Tax=Cucumis sativus TaxID=3659 RepID=UPI0012F51B10|nr:WAT1-related protein At2g39510 isoform X2 [Cucumis sativus]